MSYTKQTWANGDLITADKLNHMEDGIAASGDFIITANGTYDEENNLQCTFDKTPSEMLLAYRAGQNIKVHFITEYEDSYYTMISISPTNGMETVLALIGIGYVYNTRDYMVQPIYPMLNWEAEDESSFTNMNFM